MRFDKKYAGVPALVLTGMLACPGAAFSHDVIMQGHATGMIGQIKARTLVKGILIADNSLSCKGDATEETVSSIQNPEPIYLNIKTIYTFTQGIHGAVDAKASASEVHINVPGLKLDSSAISSFAHAQCDPDSLKVSVKGGATIADILINDNPVTITGAPNQTISVGSVAQVIFNEQIVWKTEFKVNAVHVKLFNSTYPASGDVIISYSRAKVTCEPAVAPPPV